MQNEEDYHQEENPSLFEELLGEMNRDPEMYLASRGTRFINLIIDRVAYFLLSYLMGMFIGVLGLFFGESVMNFLLPSSEWGELVYGIIIALAFYAVFESAFGKTPGKFITKTTVVTEDGVRPTFTHILGRTCCRFIPLNALSFLMYDPPVGWHDSVSKTRVVNDAFWE